MIQQAVVYKDSAGVSHDTKLQALVSEKKIELRGIVQSGANGVPIKNGSLTVQDAVAILLEKAGVAASIIKKYDKAINKERAKGAGAS